ncbi:MAG: TetR/AcrR family transcriptional regulator [Acidobacteriota bacterium]|nr:MAG: TetR/AcrR family transcriptional regulator [Acidobacteriota bacterium]
MPKVTEEHVEARKAQILQAAFRCLVSKGYSKLTIRDIAREAGLSLGTIYLYFENKEEILQVLAGATRQRADEQIEDAFPEGSPLEMIGSVFEMVLTRYRDSDSEPLMKLDLQLWAEALHHPELQELFGDGLNDRIEKFSVLIVQAQRDGLIPASLEPEAVARLYMAILMGLEVQKVLQPGFEIDRMFPAIGSFLGVSFAGRAESPE